MSGSSPVENFGSVKKKPRLTAYDNIDCQVVLGSQRGFKSAKELAEEITPIYPTGSTLESLKHIGEDGANIDWSTAESIVFGSLILKEVMFENESQCVPLNNLRPEQTCYVVCNSSLSEFGTLGFELGYSLVDPNALSCEMHNLKSLQRTSLVDLFPHGYDGKVLNILVGALSVSFNFVYIYPPPDNQHQDCNMQILIVFTSKNLRHPMARSTLDELIGYTFFERYIPEPHPETLVAPKKITRHIFCSGQVYYALLKAREQNKLYHIAILTCSHNM
ncbi:oxoglutarate dehydrogenase, E1 component [Gigaspora margarita]|uniref:Oxoglutarate dehydrogenase, E1 component n=1 Tax=Gigaspora margarita TaxID=4874 RepID=A0A8H4AUW7_GIGMA|nr:oxoglutarate dehydrogenase, E1 component [Gigaspora margarita]